MEEFYVEGFGLLPVLDVERAVRIQALTNALLVANSRHPATVRADRRAWRAKERAANLAPLSTKIKHKGGKVEVVAVKKGRGK